MATLSDPALRYAFKFGLAGILAIFIALFLRLQNPTWALFTVYVLMIAQYVGAIGEKSFFRVIGTTIGGIIGYLLTAAFEQAPIAYLLSVGAVVGFCTAMFGQSRYPYAFFLCGLTTVVVASNGLADPDQSWQYMLWRVEEVCVGVVATVLVQSVLWPRYARVEFNENARSAFADLRECLIASGDVFLKNAQNTASVRAEEFPARISGLRGLLDFGARESQLFRARLGTYFEITTTLSRIASAIVTLGEQLPHASIYRDVLGPHLEALHHALENSLDDLSKKESSSETRTEHRARIDAAFERLEAEFGALRNDPRFYEIKTEEAMIIGVHILALDDIRQEIRHAHQLLDSLPTDISIKPGPIDNFVSPIPPLFWIRNGIKSAIAVILALFIDNWVHPPGASMFILGAWVFTALNATSPGGQGDRRTFHYLIYSAVAMLLLCLILILASPLLSSYAVMNTVIFTWLFVWGYLSYRTKGVTIPMQMAMLASVGILGLNGQRPVNFQAISGLFFGIVASQVLASVIQRLLWPSLPQTELRNRFVEYLRICERLVKESPGNLPVWQKARLALIPGESTLRIGRLLPPICPEGEQAKLIKYLHSLQRVGGHLIVTIGRLVPALPSEHAERGKDFAQRMEAAILVHLQAHITSMRRTKPLITDDKPLTDLMAEMQTWVGELRSWMRDHDYPVLESGRILGLAGRYEQAGEDMLLAGERARQLRMPLYMGDYVL